jgi:hypothetical protein
MEIGSVATVLVGVGLVLILSLDRFLRSWKQRRLDAAWEARHPRAEFIYCGQTYHFYEPSHGNQVEYLDSDGRCYLWYPGNAVVLVGRWRCDESRVYFQYGVNTYNPVTGAIGGQWESHAIALWSVSIVESVPGDILGLKRGLPFVLKPRPAFRSLREPLSGASSGQGE